MSNVRVNASEIQDAIRQVQLRFSVFYGRSLARSGVTLRQFSVLVLLAKEGQQRMTDIRRGLQVSLPAVTHLVDQLVKRRCVRRIPDRGDRRVTWITFTPHGRRLTAQTQGKTLKLLTRLWLEFPSGERKVVARWFRSMASVLDGAIQRMDG